MNKSYKLYLLFCCLFVSAHTNGQSKFIEYTFQPSSIGRTTHASPVTNGWMAPFNALDCQSDKIAYINKYTSGIKYIATPESYKNYVLISDVAQTGPKEFIVSGLSWDRTDEIDKNGSLIYKMDSLGNILWKTSFIIGDFGFQNTMGSFSKAASSPDGSIYAIVPNEYIAKTDGNGKKLWLKKFSNINDILWTKKGLLAAGDNHLWLLDTSGLIVIDYIFPGKSFEKLQNLAGNKTGASGLGFSYILDTGYYKIDSVKFGFHFSEKQNNAMGFATDSAFYFYNTDSLASFGMDGKLNWKSGLPDDCAISGIAYNGNQIAVTGNGTAPFIKTYDKLGNTMPIDRQVGIVLVSQGQVSMHPSINIPDSFHVKDIGANVYVQIKNFGTEIIDSLYLESVGQYNGPHYFCAENTIEPYSNLNLAPGETKTLKLQIGRLMVGPDAAGYKLDFNANTVSPNGKLQKNATNNSYHFSNIVTGIKDNNPLGQNIIIYPNPTSNILHIDNEGGMIIKNLSLTNITGQEIANYQNQNEHFEINISSLPEGLYFAKIQNETGIVMKKIIKE